ncbi:hypothetical protein P154DRAFT_519126 [Amniculicola lignicola CBS 123094]|uniref:NAD(P)-binding domain-containing protein n=1 Tax=Amniculicola lignicola CBS 123094 TaxID=1392246 RepID=A0A6A5WU60_9PLEO|nr:hypothetical protein P154DRAFT_519126 [Amniculicola lignicola CBS 123094]
MSRPTTAFFGATGGSTSSALAHALRDGHTCTALVRTPQKLADMLKTKYSISSSTIDSLLTVIAGDIRDLTAITKALVSPTNPSNLVDNIITGVGTYPKMQLSLLTPLVSSDPSLCEDGMKAILAAMDLLRERGITTAVDGRKPLCLAISSTGVNGKKQDVPLGHRPLYSILGPIAHIDKQKMELALIADAGIHTRDFIIVRPTLLTDGKPQGYNKVKSGWEWGGKGAASVKNGVQEPGPMLGYTIAREDVGEWIWKKAMKEGEWAGKCITLAY